ncbi:tetratricopeptide repeat protein [Undibacterium danionis]|uniref:Tetratricopeptide repeat protein n=1 Tax=Undibacterium danionis TaxID=1812100 RepID=A0ABV6IBV0_9BURK
MKNLTKSLLLIIAISTLLWSPVQAQTLEESKSALARKDYRTAFAGFNGLAERGNADAQHVLGIMYDSGQGVAKNEQQAAAWYRKAADQGHAGAQRELGISYANGQGVPKDEQQAVAWLKKAAEQGHALAQSGLGVMYANGQGVPKNEQTAYFWSLLASAQGHQNAVKLRDLLEPKLPAEQRSATQEAANNWKPKLAK